jgi:hypothetical protein
MNIIPVFGDHYKSGDHFYSFSDDSFVSEGIYWMQNRDEECKFLEDLLKYGIKGFSHVGKVAEVEYHPDGSYTVWAYESSVNGVEKFDIVKKYIMDPKTKIVFRRPIGMNELTLHEALREAERLAKINTAYNFPGILGQAIMITAGLADKIPWLRKRPLPVTMPWTYFCSQFVSTIEKATRMYRHIELFKEWHPSRIHVHKLWNKFPYKRLRFE